jgi:hypothetical protein
MEGKANVSQNERAGPEQVVGLDVKVMLGLRVNMVSKP